MACLSSLMIADWCGLWWARIFSMWFFILFAYETCKAGGDSGFLVWRAALFHKLFNISSSLISRINCRYGACSCRWKPNGSHGSDSHLLFSTFSDFSAKWGLDSVRTCVCFINALITEAWFARVNLWIICLLIPFAWFLFVHSNMFLISDCLGQV